MTKTLDELANDPFWQGFYWTIDVIRAMGIEVDSSKLVEMLRAVASGEATLIPSPADSVHEETEELNNLRRAIYRSTEWRRVGMMNDRTKAQEYVDVID